MPSRPRARSLDDLLEQFKTLSDQASALLGKFSPEQIARRPEPQRWSVAECLTHLIISADAYFDTWHAELAQARERGRIAEAPYRQDFVGWLLAWSLEPPPKFKMQAPPVIVPVSVGPAEEILPAFLERHRRIAEVLESAHGLAIDRIKIASLFDARVRYSVWSSLCITAAHERRHLWQAERAI